jgi:hypothetical protein
MIKKSLLIWIIILTFGFASMPVLGFSVESKQTGKTESSSNKTRKKHSKKTTKKKSGKKNKKSSGKSHKKGSKKHKGSKKYKSGGKKKHSKYSKGKKHGKYSKGKKHSKYSKGKKHGKYSKGKKHGKYSKKHGKKNRTTYVRKHYTPPTNSNNVEYRNYKRNGDENKSNENIEKIAPQKEIRKEPKKEGDK